MKLLALSPLFLSLAVFSQDVFADHDSQSFAKACRVILSDKIKNVEPKKRLAVLKLVVKDINSVVDEEMSHYDSEIEQLLIKGDEISLKASLKQIEGFSRWYVPAAKWFIDISELRKMNKREQAIRFVALVDELRGRLISYHKALKTLVDGPLHEIKKGKAFIPFKSYLIFLPVLANVLKDHVGDERYDDLWAIFSFEVDMAESLLHRIPGILDLLSPDEAKAIKMMNRVLDVPVEDILFTEKWVTDAQDITSRYRRALKDCK
jgi:hypothetical protein